MPRVTCATPITRVVAGVAFRDGEADTDNASALAYFRRRDGYQVHDTPKRTRRSRSKGQAAGSGADDDHDDTGQDDQADDTEGAS